MWDAVRSRQGHNAPVPLRRSPPVSFKRLLGGVPFTSSIAAAISLRKGIPQPLPDTPSRSLTEPTPTTLPSGPAGCARPSPFDAPGHGASGRGLSSIPDFAGALRISVPLAHGRVLLGVDEAPQLRESRSRIVPGPVQRRLRRCLQLLLKNALSSRWLCHLDNREMGVVARAGDLFQQEV